MPLVPTLPFEFVVRGVAVSQQGSAAARETWKETVRTAARAALPEGSWLITSNLAVTIFVFPADPMQGDVDNRVKPILDAMNRCVYADDELIERVVVQKFEPDRMFAFQAPSSALQSALEAEEPTVYIRVSDDPHEELS